MADPGKYRCPHCGDGHGEIFCDICSGFIFECVECHCEIFHSLVWSTEDRYHGCPRSGGTMTMGGEASVDPRGPKKILL